MDRTTRRLLGVGVAVGALTAVVHAVLAAGVVAHAKFTDRDAGRWPLWTLLGGLLGVLGYVRRGR